MIDECLALLSQDGKSAKTVAVYQRECRVFLVWCLLYKGNADFVNLTAEDAALYRTWLLEDCGASNDVADRMLRSVAQLSDYMMRQELVPSSYKNIVNGNEFAPDLTGKTFGNLRVLYRSAKPNAKCGVHTKWTCQCALCGTIVEVRGASLKNGCRTDCGCRRNIRISEACTEDRTNKTYGHLKVLGRDTSIAPQSGQHSRWMCRCDLCGTVESVSSSALDRWKKDRCRKCLGLSQGEAKIADLLTEHNIQFVHDKPYGNCRNDITKFPLRFDFRVTNPQNDCLYIIEYDGLQHFQAAPMWDENGDFNERVRRDNLKNDWCQQHQIPLIRIPYTQLSKLSFPDVCLESTSFRVV